MTATADPDQGNPQKRTCGSIVGIMTRQAVHGSTELIGKACRPEISVFRCAVRIEAMAVGMKDCQGGIDIFIYNRHTVVAGSARVTVPAKPGQRLRHNVPDHGSFICNINVTQGALRSGTSLALFLEQVTLVKEIMGGTYDIGPG